MYLLITRSLFVFLGLTLLVITVALLIDPPPWDSDNLQYIPLVFFATVFYPPMLTPAVTTVMIWRTIVKKLENNG